MSQKLLHAADFQQSLVILVPGVKNFGEDLTLASLMKIQPEDFQD
jgi:hypothetical protein